MITYNPKDWFTFIFRIHKSETFKQLIPLLIGIILYATVVSYVELHTLIRADIRELTKGIANIYSILGFTLSLLLVFRTNSAYDRWWDGRKLWGELTNSSRAFCAHINGILKKDAIQERQNITSLVSIYAYTLHVHLKGKKVDEEYYKEELKGSSLQNEIESFSNAKHQPLEVYTALIKYIQVLHLEGKLNTQEIYHFKSEINTLINVCGGCERIKSTPIPFSYSVFLKKFIFFYVMLFPVIYCFHMSYFIVPVTAFILYVLASIELIAEEIEDPFGGDANDLPTKNMALNIANNSRQILL